MAGTVIFCTRCRAPLPAGQYNLHRMTPCPTCGADLIVAAFPALLADTRTGRIGERVIADDQASCFYHTSKKASVVCDRCGRFLCELCDIEVGAGHLCPACVAAGSAAGGETELDVRRTYYDRLALRLAIYPTLITPLFALYLTARHGRTRNEIVPRGQGTWIAAVTVAVAQLLAWAGLGLYLFL